MNCFALATTTRPNTIHELPVGSKISSRRSPRMQSYFEIERSYSLDTIGDSSRDVLMNSFSLLNKKSVNCHHSNARFQYNVIIVPCVLSKIRENHSCEAKRNGKFHHSLIKARVVLFTSPSYFAAKFGPNPISVFTHSLFVMFFHLIFMTN